MKTNKVITAVKVVLIAVYVVPPVVQGAICVTKAATNLIVNEVSKSKTIKEIKKSFELRREGVITVDYQEVDD